MTRFTLALSALALTCSSGALACSVVLPQDYEGSRAQQQNVRAAIESATLIVDGEVIRAWTPASPALVRVHHVLKGSSTDVIEVGSPGAGGDCSIALDRLGERSRMILSGGPERYDLFRDQSEARLEDQILDSDRRKVWPYISGQPNG
jgi:hypothetical protein